MKIKTAKKLLSNIRFSQTRNAARKKMGSGLMVQDIEITAEDLMRKYSEQNGRCYLSGVSLNEDYNYITRHPLAISVDRIDNKKGYFYDNFALTLRIFNLGKGSYTGDFEEVIGLIKESWNSDKKIAMTEENELKGKQAVFDGAGISIENDWDVTPYGECK